MYTFLFPSHFSLAKYSMNLLLHEDFRTRTSISLKTLAVILIENKLN